MGLIANILFGLEAETGEFFALRLASPREKFYPFRLAPASVVIFRSVS